MKKHTAGLKSVYVALVCWLSISLCPSMATEIILTEHCENTIRMDELDSRGFILRSQARLLYQNNEWCSLKIKTSDQNNYILLHFESFDLELAGACIWDYLLIKFSASSTEDKLCGSSIPSDYLSESEIELFFETDLNNRHQGFTIIVTEVSRWECDESVDYHCEINDHCIDGELASDESNEGGSDESDEGGSDESDEGGSDEPGYNIEDYCGNEDFILPGGELEDEEDDEIEIILICVGVVVCVCIFVGICFGVYFCCKSEPLKVNQIGTISTTIASPQQHRSPMASTFTQQQGTGPGYPPPQAPPYTPRQQAPHYPLPPPPPYQEMSTFHSAGHQLSAVETHQFSTRLPPLYPSHTSQQQQQQRQNQDFPPPPLAPLASPHPQAKQDPLDFEITNGTAPVPEPFNYHVPSNTPKN